MSRIVLFPYKVTSRSAKKLFAELAETTEVFMVTREEYVPKVDDVVIGWGSGYWPEWRTKAENAGIRWLNPSNRISSSVDKTISFDLFRAAGVRHPENTSSRHVARTWLNEGHSVLARQEIEGRDGAGIVFLTPKTEFVNAPLYSKYEEKTDEFRVHVFKGKAFWSQERHPIEEEDNKYFTRKPNPLIRTSDQGWTLYVANAKIPAVCKREAEKAIAAVGLDFGAVDIGYNANARDERNSVCIYEVNTAPELSDRTCEAYAKTIVAHIN